MSLVLLGIALACLIPLIVTAILSVEFDAPNWLSTRVGVIFFRLLTRGKYPRGRLEPPQDLIISLFGAALIGLTIVLGILFAIPLAHWLAAQRAV